MLTTEEMRLKSRAQATPIDSSSSSLMVLLANSGNSTRRPNVAHVKLKKPCFNFDKGFCHFCDNCKFIHGGTSNGVNGNNSLWSTSNVCHASLSTTTPSMAHNQMMALIQTQQALLAQLGYNGNLTLGKSTINPGNTQHVALNTGINGPIQSISHATSPPGFASTYPMSHAHGQAASSQVQMMSRARNLLGQSGPIAPTGQETILPNAFSAMTLLDPTTVNTQFKCEIKSFQCDHGQLDNHALHTLFASKGKIWARDRTRMCQDNTVSQSPTSCRQHSLEESLVERQRKREIVRIP
ncbi:hybrid signal transduction histidine kinase M [Tanacetum coccineum]